MREEQNSAVDINNVNQLQFFSGLAERDRQRFIRSQWGELNFSHAHLFNMVQGLTRSLHAFWSQLHRHRWRAEGGGVGICEHMFMIWKTILPWQSAVCFRLALIACCHLWLYLCCWDEFCSWVRPRKYAEVSDKYVGTTVAVDYSQLSNSTAQTDTAISQSLSHPSVNMLQGTYIWMHVERKDGAVRGEEVDIGKREGRRLKGSNQQGKTVMWPNVLHTNWKCIHMQKCLRIQENTHTHKNRHLCSERSFLSEQPHSTLLEGKETTHETINTNTHTHKHNVYTSCSICLAPLLSGGL